MEIDHIIEGLRILQPHYKQPDGFHTAADHDQFFMEPTDTPLSPGQVQRMCALGWFQPEGGASERHEENYSEDDGWSFFT